MISWWDKSSDEEKMAQVIGGIECGMTKRHIAMNLRVDHNVIVNFGVQKKLSFTAVNGGKHNSSYGYKLSVVSKMRKQGITEVDNIQAFSLFDLEKEKPIFDKHQND